MRGGKGVIRVLVAAFVLSTVQPIISAQSVSPTFSDEARLEHSNSAQISSTPPSAGTPIDVTLLGIMDGGGHDRYGVIVLRRGDWLLEDINWVDRSGTDAVSLLLAGRRLHISRRLDISLLAGPWYEYANRAWDEAVIDTNVQFHGERFRLVSVNHWGVALKSTGGFFDSHVATGTGIPGLPRWLGASGEIEHSPGSVDTLWAGPVFTKKRSQMSLSGVPYWDVLRHTAGVRLTVSYHLALEPKREHGQNIIGN